jgi:hypothetical protein
MEHQAPNLMDTSTDTMDDQVDTVLHKIALSANLTLNLNELYNVSVMNENSYLLDHFMLEKGLLKIAKEGRTITGKGLEIANFGGWIAYQRQLKKESRNVYGLETLQRKYESEIASLRNEIKMQKNELEARAEKEEALSQTIRNLIEQNKSNKLMMLMGGIVTGIVLSSVLWYFLF